MNVFKTKSNPEEMRKLEQYWDLKMKIKIKKYIYTLEYLCGSTSKSFKYRKVPNVDYVFFTNYTSSDVERVC